MENNFTGNQILFCTVLRNIKESMKYKIEHVRNRNKQLLTKEGDIMARWLKHFQKCLDSNNSKDTTGSMAQSIDNEEEDDEYTSIDEF